MADGSSQICPTLQKFGVNNKRRSGGAMSLSTFYFREQAAVTRLWKDAQCWGQTALLSSWTLKWIKVVNTTPLTGQLVTDRSFFARSFQPVDRAKLRSLSWREGARLPLLQVSLNLIWRRSRHQEMFRAWPTGGSGGGGGGPALPLHCEPIRPDVYVLVPPGNYVAKLAHCDRIWTCFRVKSLANVVCRGLRGLGPKL